MKTISIPVATASPPRVRDIRCEAPRAPVWEYKIAIARANTSADPNDVQEQFLKILGRHGWVFVSESQGIYHFKRPKQ